jgi:hypothetical protein
MKLAAVTVTDNPNNHGFLLLQQSAKRHGYDFYPLVTRFYGFGTKIIETAKAAEDLKRHGYSHILFMDAHDTYFLRPEKSIKSALFDPGFMFVSAEKACWPDPHKASDYHYQAAPPSPWCYVNSGQYLAPIDTFLQIVEENPIQHEADDQRWLTGVYLQHTYPIILDINCKIFQSIAFADDNDFRTDERGLINTITRSRPFAAHGNGKTPMEWIYQIK